MVWKTFKYVVLMLSVRCLLCDGAIQRQPPCALLSWKGTDVQKPFNISGKLTYLRYDSATYYSPFSVYNATYLGAFCIYAHVSYSKSRLNIDLLCTNGTQYHGEIFPPTDTHRVEVANVWKDCRKITYRVKLQNKYNVLYLRASNRSSGDIRTYGNMFLAVNEFTDANLRMMDQNFDQKYALHQSIACDCSHRTELSVVFKIPPNGASRLCSMSCWTIMLMFVGFVLLV
uniref:Uncharacterized protein n=1 Tax=Anopheles coluzzii TaxID=1518534 RepID=A0A8W7Q0T2_ANOCL